jgi:enoyl-CoA hydratase/carnithine racemase
MELRKENVVLRREGRIGILTLNRPGKLNALNVSLIRELGEVLNHIREDDEMSVIIVTGEGRAFSVGADMEVIGGLGSPKTFRKVMRERWHSKFDAMEDMEKLFIAALNGFTLGGGLELALACDLRVAAEGVKLALPEIGFGLIPDAGGTIRLSRLVGPSAAKELILSGEAITSEEAKALGLVNKVLPAENFLQETMEYAKKFADKSPVALGLGKVAVNRNLNQDIKSGLDDAVLIQSILLETPEYAEALKALMEKQSKGS